MNRYFFGMGVAVMLSMPAMASASTISWQTSNSTAATIDNTSYKPCNAVAATLPSIASGAVSAATTIGCGTSSLVSFDYEGGGKKCQFSLAVFLNGTSYMPNGGAKSVGSVKATCKIVNLGASGFGSYNFSVIMQ